MRTRQDDLDILKSYHSEDFIAIYDIFSAALQRSDYKGLRSFEALLDDIGMDKSSKDRWLRSLNDHNHVKLSPSGNERDKLTLKKINEGNLAVSKKQAKLADFMLTVCEKIGWEINVYTGEAWSKEERIYLSHKYISYYWNEKANRSERTVKKGSVFIDYVLTPDGKVEILDFRLKLLSSKKDIERFSILKSSRISQTEDILYVHLVDPGTRTLQTNLTLSFNTGNFPEGIITGTYSTVRRGNRKLPIAGRVVLAERSGDLTEKGIMAAPVPPEIYSYLYRSSIYGNDKFVQSIHDLPSAQEISELKPYAGQYHCTYYRKRKGMTEQENHIEKFFFEVDENGEASMTVVKDKGHITYRGRMRALGSKRYSLIAYMDFMPEDNTYRFTIYFDKQFKGADRTLFAIYGGLERDHPEIPTAGRMVFRQLEKRVASGEIPKMVEAIPQKKISEWAAANPLNREDRKFLSGFDQYDYLETLPPDEEAKELTQDFAYEGTYFVYSLSTMQHAVHKIPLIIDGQGLVKMKTRNERSRAFHQGEATVGTNRFSIHMERAGSPSDHFHFIFNKPGVPGKFKHLFGVSSKVDTQNSPAGRLEVLVREKFDFESTPSQTIEVGSDEYIAENKTSKRLLEYLTGKYNRYVVAKSKPDDSFKRTNQKFYFYASCYLCANFDQHQHPEKIDEALRLLYQAYLHGFGHKPEDQDLLKKEMDNSFLKVVDREESSCPESSSLEELTFLSLIELILKRAKKA